MTQDIFGGVEGGASVSTIVLLDGNGKCLAESSGAGTNYWIVGMEEVRHRIAGMVEDALKKANLPKDTKIKCLCLSLSGASEEVNNEEFKKGFFEHYPNLCDRYVICGDTFAPIATAKSGGGAVLIAGTGSNAHVINLDGSELTCGGWGHLLGDEGSAYWIASKGLKIYFDHVDRLEKVPCDFDTEILWETIRSYFGVQTRIELLPHLYKNFSKFSIAGLCKELSIKAREGDQLCQWLFTKAGEYLAKHLTALSHGIDQELLQAEGGLAVVCVGSVWKSWDLLEPGFMKQFLSNPEKLTEFSLLTLITKAAVGAAYIAAETANCHFPKDYSHNCKLLYHYKKP